MGVSNIVRRCVTILCLLSVLGACGEENTGDHFTGEYQFGFPEETDRSALEVVAEDCGRGSGVKAARVGTGASVDGEVVIVEFASASMDDQERVLQCAEAAGSDFTVVP